MGSLLLSARRLRRAADASTTPPAVLEVPEGQAVQARVGGGLPPPPPPPASARIRGGVMAWWECARQCIFQPGPGCGSEKPRLVPAAAQLLHDGLNAYVKDCSKLLVTWERTGKKPDVSQYSHDKPKEAGGEEAAGDEGAAAAQSKTEMDASGILDSDEEDDEAERAEEQAEVVSTTGNSSANRDAAV
jgi:hypothetical protein